MKLCQKCLNNMPCYFEGANWDEIDGYAEKRPVDESICEFWAHKRLRERDSQFFISNPLASASLLTQFLLADGGLGAGATAGYASLKKD